MLTAKSIVDAGLELEGWVANRMDPDCELQDENVAALLERLPAPLLADIGYAGENRAALESEASRINLADA